MEENQQKQKAGPVTVIVKRHVRPGRQKEYEAWYSAFMREAARFPGFMGVDIIRPRGPKDTEYVFIVRFDSYENLKAWDESPVRAEWLEKSRALAEDDMRIQKYRGIEFWFTLPEKSDLGPPPNYKMAAITILATFPLVVILEKLLAPVIGALHPWLQTLVFVFVLILFMTYAVMPLMTRIFSGWLFKPGNKND